MSDFRYTNGELIKEGDVVSFGVNLVGVVEYVEDDSDWNYDGQEDPIGVYIYSKEVGDVRVSILDPDLVLIKRA